MEVKTKQWYKKNVRQKNGNREHQLQCACVKWFRLQYPQFQKLLFAVPNGAQLKGGGRAWVKIEREGGVAGVADLFLSVPSGELCGLYIEMKTEKGRQQDSQKEFEEAVVGKGYGYTIPRSQLQFENAIKIYLEKGEY